MARIYMIGSQKGGVGKTTTTLNLAYSLAKMGKKVLAVDFDSQANITIYYGVGNTGELDYTIGHLMMAVLKMRRCQDISTLFRVRTEWTLFRQAFICQWLMRS